MAGRIFMMGDTHSTLDGWKLFAWNKTKMVHAEVDRDDFVIQCGDFGFIWNATETDDEKKLLDRIEAQGFSLLVITGNHDNIPAIRENYPLVDFHGDKAYEIRPHIHIAPYGAYYNINGKSILCIGGAHCHDINDGVYYPHELDKMRELDRAQKFCYRIIGKTWWPEEVPNDRERQHIKDVVNAHECKADIIVSHQPPISTCVLAGFTWHEPDEYGVWLETQIKSRVSYEYWYSGHMHVDKQLTNRDYILYDNVLLVPQHNFLF